MESDSGIDSKDAMNDDDRKEAALLIACVEAQASDWNTKARRSDRLLVRMNHEIRTAVNLILGLTDSIPDPDVSPSLLSHLSIACASAERLLKESAEILDLARAELGSLQLCSLDFRLNETLQQAIACVASLAASQGVRLRFQPSLKPLMVIGDPGRLSQILITLMRASLERMEQGEISVSVECGSNVGAGNNITVSITDNGPRIPPEQIRRMFEGGFQQDTAMLGRSELALVLARHLAWMMEGDLWAEEEPRTGAVFHFNVNLHTSPMSDLLRLGKVGAEPRADRRPLKILVAEDSFDTVRVIRGFLKDVPWGIESTDNGRTALEMAVSRSYDLILMDLDMPEMNGYVATRQIRMAEYLNGTPAVPIVALTAHNEAEAGWESIEAGCTAHLSKPIRKAELIEAIELYAVDIHNGRESARIEPDRAYKDRPEPASCIDLNAR